MHSEREEKLIRRIWKKLFILAGSWYKSRHICTYYKYIQALEWMSVIAWIFKGNKLFSTVGYIWGYSKYDNYNEVSGLKYLLWHF